MNKEQLIKLGSQTAKSGFQNEDDVVKKFNNWETDEDAQKWLKIMGYNLREIEYIKAVKVSGYKTDVQVQVTIKLKIEIDVENLQVKLVSNPKGFNQIDKRWINAYVKMWDIPNNIAKLLRYFTGEISPYRRDTKDSRRMFANEFSLEEQQLLLDFIRNNQCLIINDVLKGRGKFAAEWMLVIQKISRNSRWILRSMNYVINYFGNGEVLITNRGSIKIKRITIQRKGGDGGRDTAKMLQFKINPAELFED
ncbi:hypothetical protein ES703_05113 [subsurface metagenome]